jgi:colanic acid biosynthesis glycosyl transferase WcaI
MTEEGSELAQVVKEEGVGWIVPPGDPDRLTNAIVEILESRGRLDAMGEAARRAALEKYSHDVALDRYGQEL